MNRITYILPADYAVCAKPAGFLLPKIKKGVTGTVDFLTFGHRDTDALRFENMDIAEELLSLTDGSACEQMRLSGRRSMGALFRCPHVVLM